jgi:hypothetical protein
MKQSQKNQILNQLQHGDKITPLDALTNFGCFRLSSIIFTLRNEGYNIKTNLIRNKNNNSYAQYSLTQ